MVRVVVVAALVAALLVVAKHEQLFERTGIVGSCDVVHSPIGDTAVWRACKEGLLTGHPNLLGDGCTYELRASGTEYWRCPGQANSS